MNDMAAKGVVHQQEAHDCAKQVACCRGGQVAGWRPPGVQRGTATSAAVARCLADTVEQSTALQDPRAGRAHPPTACPTTAGGKERPTSLADQINMHRATPSAPLDPGMNLMRNPESRAPMNARAKRVWSSVVPETAMNCRSNSISGIKLELRVNRAFIVAGCY